MTRQITKHQHYVARVYLRQFATVATQGQRNPSIHRFSKENKRYLGERSTKRVAFEEWMYSPPEDEEQFLESFFSDIENDVTQVLSDLSTHGNLDVLSDKDKTTLAMFLAAQHVRTLRRKHFAVQALNATLFHGEENPERIQRQSH